MTINFKGFHDAGAIKYGRHANSGALTNQKFWLRITGQDLEETKPLLEKCPSKDEFTRIEFSTDEEPIDSSFIKINNKKIPFYDIPTEDVPIVLMAKKLIQKIADPKKELKLTPGYLDGDEAFANTYFKHFDVFPKKDQNEIIEISHEPEGTKIMAEEGVDIINQKLSQAFNP